MNDRNTAGEAAGENGLLEGRSMRSLNPVLKLALEVGPLVVFFIANQRAGIFAATGAVHGRRARRRWRCPTC